MAHQKCTTLLGINELQTLVIELEKSHPDIKLIKSLTTKYGIPYKIDTSEQLNELLIYLNGLSTKAEDIINNEV